MMNDCHTHNYIVTIYKVHIEWLLFHITWNILSLEHKGGTENVINNFYSCYWRCTKAIASHSITILCNP